MGWIPRHVGWLRVRADPRGLSVFLSRVHENYKGERRGDRQVWGTEIAPSSVGREMLSVYSPVPQCPGSL